MLHTADLHLGKVLHEQSLLEDQKHVLDQLASELESGGYDLFVVAGDVFDRSVPPPEAVSLWDDFLYRIAVNRKLETVVVSGNHDGAQRMAFASRFFDHHRIHVRTGVEGFDLPLTLTLDGAEWDIFAVPFLQAGTLEAKRGQDEPMLLRTQRDLWQEATARLAKARRPGIPSVLVTHLFTLGGKESDSERLFVGEAEQIPASWLTGWDAVALGHLHRTQQASAEVWYSGSPLAYSFSEAGQVKAALRWENGIITSVPLNALRPLTRLSGTFEEFALGDYTAYRDHWLELTLTDPALVPGPLERLRPRFPGLLSLVQAPARVSSSDLTETPRRRTGDVAADTLRFLEDVGQSADSATQTLITDLVREASVETP